MTDLDLYPKTKAVPVGTLRAGHVVVESDGYPAVVVRVAYGAQKTRWVTVYCRYIWQGSQELAWILGGGKLLSSTPVDRAV